MAACKKTDGFKHVAVDGGQGGVDAMESDSGEEEDDSGDSDCASGDSEGESGEEGSEGESGEEGEDSEEESSEGEDSEDNLPLDQMTRVRSAWEQAELEGQEMMRDYKDLLVGAEQIVINGHPIGAFLSRDFVRRVAEMDHAKIWEQCRQKEQYGDREVLQKHDGTVCKWLPGTNPALHYRGNAIQRAKLWVQEGYDTYVQYGYTGWQNQVAYAACK